MGEIDVRSRLAERDEPDIGYGEVVVAIRKSDGIFVYEGLADRIEHKADFDTVWGFDSRLDLPTGGSEMNIHFVGSMREVVD